VPEREEVVRRSSVEGCLEGTGPPLLATVEKVLAEGVRLDEKVFVLGYML
jgi:hypothetical protein